METGTNNKRGKKMKKEKCEHETGILIKIKGEERTLEHIVCTRCSTSTENKGEYEEKKGAIMEVYERDGLYKRYKVYTKR